MLNNLYNRPSMPFYEYNQNNSGGSFVVNDKVCHRVIIEADSKSAAEMKAEDLGIYFNGVDAGYDCECCEDRWYPPWDTLTFPMPYGGMTKVAAEVFAKKYKITARPMTKGKVFGDNTHEVVFENVKQYAQYMADEYGWTDPDVRIYFADGFVSSIVSKGSK